MFGKQQRHSNMFTIVIFLTVWLAYINCQAARPLPKVQEHYNLRVVEQYRHIEIPMTAKEAYLTESVPGYKSGRDVKDYESLFKAKKIPVTNGKLSLSLSSTPVFIETTAQNHIQNITHSADSPFGIAFAGFIKDANIALPIMKDLGASQVRFLGPWGGLAWDIIEPEKGKYFWSEKDEIYTKAHSLGLEIMVNLYAINAWDQPEIDSIVLSKSRITRRPAKYPNDMAAYLSFVRRCVERYDGDGNQDAAGNPKVKWWIIGSEMSSPTRWVDTPENYGKLFVETYKVIRANDPEATILMFGENLAKSRKKRRISAFFLPVLKEIRKQITNLPDLTYIFPIHHYSPDPASLIYEIKQARQLLDSAGFKDTTIWVTDSATFTSTNPSRGKFRTEKELAQDVIKLHCVGLAHGIGKYIWAQLSDGYYGSKKRQTIEGGFIGKLNRTQKTTYKKLAYFSYKLMIDKLADSEWNSVEVVCEGENGCYVYGFKKKNGNTTYVAWAEYGSNSQ